MPKSQKQYDEEILHTKLCLKLSDYAMELHKPKTKGESVTSITERHANYIISFLREYLQKDYGS